MHDTTEKRNEARSPEQFENMVGVLGEWVKGRREGKKRSREYVMGEPEG